MQSSGAAPGDLPDVTYNSLDDPPCSCGNDLGQTGNLPVYVRGSAGLAQPRPFVYVATVAPAKVTLYLNLEDGAEASRVVIPKGYFHVVAFEHGGASQFRVPSDAIYDEDLWQFGSFWKTTGNIADDSRAVLLRNFWRNEGYEVQPLAIRRSGRGVPVWGRIEAVRLTTRWFDGNDVYGHLGQCTVIDEADCLRFLKPAEVSAEFVTLSREDGSSVGF